MTNRAYIIILCSLRGAVRAVKFWQTLVCGKASAAAHWALGALASVAAPLLRNRQTTPALPPGSAALLLVGCCPLAHDAHDAVSKA